MEIYSLKLVFITLLFSVFANNLFAQKNEWRFVKESDDVAIYFRNAKDTNVKELKMVYTLDCSLAAVVQLLDDVENYNKWVYKLDETYIVERINRTDFYYYNKIDFPWPLSDRDMIGYSKMWLDKTSGKVYANVKNAPTKIAVNENVVRIEILDIQWVIAPISNQKVKVEYILKSDPAGNIPDWMVNLALEEGPLKTVENMRVELKKERYRGGDLSLFEK